MTQPARSKRQRPAARQAVPKLQPYSLWLQNENEIKRDLSWELRVKCCQERWFPIKSNIFIVRNISYAHNNMDK